MKAVRGLFSAALAALVLTGCLLPPFDADLSKAYKTARKMTRVAKIGPLYYWQGQRGGQELRFLPSKAFGPSNGLLVAASDYTVALAYVETTSSGDSNVFAERNFIIDSTAADYTWQIHMLKDDTLASDYFILHDWAGTVAVPVRDDLRGLRHNPFAPDILDEAVLLSKWDTLAAPTTGTLAGVSLVPRNDAALDYMSVLEAKPAPAFTEHLVDVSRTGFGGVTPTPITLPGAAANGWYQRNPATGRSVYSFRVGPGDYATYTWTGVSPVPVPTTNRIDVLLTGDLLYHRGDGTDKVYRPDGKLEHEFPVGDLRLAYERYVAGVPTLYYTLVYWDRSGGGDADLYIEVYTIPTAKLGDLE